MTLPSVETRPVLHAALEDSELNPPTSRFPHPKVPRIIQPADNRRRGLMEPTTAGRQRLARATRYPSGRATRRSSRCITFNAARHRLTHAPQPCLHPTPGMPPAPHGQAPPGLFYPTVT